MGWKRTLRSLEAASRQSQRERDRQVRTTHRELDRLERKVDASIERVRKQILDFEERLRKDALQTLRPRYHRDHGMVCEDVSISSEMLSFTLSVMPSKDEDQGDPGRFEPSVMTAKQVTVRPLQLLLFKYATLVAFEIESDDPAARTRISWVRKQDRTSSAVYLTDPLNHEYYYPLATDLSGELVAGRSKLGLVAFEPFRVATDHVDLHFSPKALPGDESTLDLAYRSAGLRSRIESVLRERSLVERAEELIADFQRKAAEEVRGARPKSQAGTSGCALIVLAVLIGLIIMMVINRGR